MSTVAISIQDRHGGSGPATSRAGEQSEWLPFDLTVFARVSAVVASGVFSLSVAYALGRGNHSNGQVFYWLGQILLIAPIAWRVLSNRRIGLWEGWGLVLLLGAAQYLGKWMYSPGQLKFPDELQHFRGTTNAVDSGQLFTPNLPLPISPKYPGLEAMGAAVTQMTGLSITSAALLVAAVAHLVFMGALFLTTWRVLGAPWIATLACLIYASNPHFDFFDSMYLYQTAGLTFLMLVIWAARAWRPGSPERGGLFVVGVMSIAVVTVSHHVTSFIMVTALIVLAGCDLIGHDRVRSFGSLALAAVATLSVGLWTVVIAPETLAYLRPAVRQVLESLTGLLSGQLGGVGAGSAPLITPLSDRIIGLLGLLAVLYTLAKGSRWALRKVNYDPWNPALLLGTLALLAFTALRFVAHNGAELSGRAATFYYVPVAMLVSLGIADAIRHKPGVAAAARWSVVVVVVFLSGIAGGWPPHWGRLPGPYLVSAFERSVDSQALNASTWALATLGPGNRWSGDRNMTTLLGTVGAQDPVHPGAALFYESAPSPSSQELVKTNAIRFLAVDTRLSGSVPLSGSYFDNDPYSNDLTEPISALKLMKFDQVEGISRLYDNGDVRLYDLSRSWYVY